MAPQIPAKWKKVSYTRPFRGTDFQIEVVRGAKAGVTVNGQAVEGNFVAVPKEGLGKKTVKVVCTLA